MKDRIVMGSSFFKSKLSDKADSENENNESDEIDDVSEPTNNPI